MTIETRPYGQTGDEVTVIGLGGGGLYKLSFTEGVATVRRALELGVTYFDTSPEYGGGMSQAILGDALEGRLEKYLLATKLGRLGTPARYRSYDAVRAQLDENLRLLGRNSVDVLQIHHVDMPVWWTDTPPPEERTRLDPDYDFAGAPVMQVLRGAKEEGLCRYIGPTENSFEAVARILPTVDFDMCLPTRSYDILQRGARRDVLPLARAKNVTVVLGGIFRVLRIFENTTEWLASPPSGTTPELRDRVERLYAVQRESGLSVVELTIRYLLADRDVTAILVGASTPAEIEESVPAAEKGRLPGDLHQTLEEMGTL